MAKFAIIKTGGKQYKVSEGDSISIEKIKGELKEGLPRQDGPAVGDKISFKEVLLVDDGKETKIGTPYLEKVKVEGVLEKEGKGKKVTVIRYRSKSRYFKKKGHRQPYFKVKIDSIK